MNPVFNKNVVINEIFHKQFNIDSKHTIDEIPECAAVFGVFGIIHDTPVHARYVSSTANLREAILQLYENPPSDGMQKFMQTSWIQMLCFENVDNLSQEEIGLKLSSWESAYKPAVTSDGEYPSYEYEWPYNEDGSMKSEYLNPPNVNF